MKRWQIIFEVTLDIEEGDTQMAAIHRAKAAVDPLIGEKIAHYHVLQWPKEVWEFD